MDVQGDARGGVPQHLGVDLGIDVLRGLQRGAGVVEVVEADRRQSRLAIRLLTARIF